MCPFFCSGDIRNSLASAVRGAFCFPGESVSCIFFSGGRRYQSLESSKTAAGCVGNCTYGVNCKERKKEGRLLSIDAVLNCVPTEGGGGGGGVTALIAVVN